MAKHRENDERTSRLGCGHCGGGGTKKGTGMIRDDVNSKMIDCVVCNGSGWIKI